jgi:hypothetical protein
MSFQNETSTVAGSTLTQKDFMLSDLDTVNRFILANPKIATISATASGATVTDVAGDLSANTELSSFVTSGKLRFTCDTLAAPTKRFVVSEDCASTDAGVTIKNIYDMQDVATDVAALTLDTTS